MKKIYQRFCVILALTLVLGVLAMGSAAAKPDDGWQLPKTEAARTQSLTTLTLQESLDGSNWIQTVLGDLVGGYTMALSGTAGAMEYLDVASLAATPAVANGLYPFILDVNRLPAGYYAYWAGKGVTAAAVAPSWEYFMWRIINGQLPIFYLKVAGGEWHLVDGLAYQLDPNTSTPVRVDGDYPLHTYNYQGTLTFVGDTSQTLVVGISFTHQATAELWVGGVEPTAIVIDGCGYVDVTIRLNSVTDDLYSLDLGLTFNQNLVEVMDMDADPANGVNLTMVAPWAAHVVQNVAYNVDDPATPLVNEAGTIRLISSLYNTETPVNGSFDVAVMRLRAKAWGSSTIGFSLVELSDRDGYLIGAPYILGGPNTDFSYPVTTQFTAAGGLDLNIIRLNPSTVQLSWPQASTDSVTTYKLHRSAIPYFTPGTTTVYQTITNNGTTTHIFDDAVLGNVDINYFYSLQIVCSSGLESPASWQVGKFEYELYETNTSDNTIIGFVLENPAMKTSNDLAAHIENNIYSGEVKVLSVSMWNPDSQGLTTLGYPADMPFTLTLKQAYRVSVDITGDLNPYLSVIWAQVGRLPQITKSDYTLIETQTTDYVWILLPLEMSDIVSDSGLIARIKADTANDVDILAVSRFDSEPQSWTTSAFSTRFGYPYRLSVDVKGASPTYYWP